jgi:hypothetical protein
MMHSRVCFYIKTLDLSRKEQELKQKEKDVKALERLYREK